MGSYMEVPRKLLGSLSRVPLQGPYLDGSMVYTWAMKGLPYYYFGLHVCIRTILGPFGKASC